MATKPDAHLTPTPRTRPGRSLPNTCPYASFGSQKIQPYVGIRVDGGSSDIISLISACNKINGLANHRLSCNLLL